MTDQTTRIIKNQGNVLTVSHNSQPIEDTIKLSGGKHGFSHDIPVAALASEGVLYNVPNIIDATTLIEALRLIFEHVEYDKVNYILRFSKPLSPRRVELSSQLLSKSRSLFGFMPAILSHGHTLIMEGLPVGCDMGDRPNSWYFETLEKFGVKIDASPKEILLTWENRHPANIRFEYPTMTGTVIAIAAASAVEGTSSLNNASVEPSCIEELDCAASMGIEIEGFLPEIKITGKSYISRVEWHVLHDRVHACTYITAALLTRGKITVTADRNINVPRFVEFLRNAGVEVTDTGTSITVDFPKRGYLNPVRIDTGSEPLFSSDWMAPIVLLLATRSKGKSIVTDNVFPDRLQCLDNLKRLGLNNVKLTHTTIAGRCALYAEIDGRPDMMLKSGNIGECPDLRGSTALALAALVADGPVTIDNDFHLRRGYEDLPATLEELRKQSKKIKEI